MNLNGVFAPLTTPFKTDESLALEDLRKNVARYNATGLSGYVITGSTGEAVLLTRSEIEQVWASVREAAESGKTLIAGTGVDSTSETISRTNRAAALGYHAALVKTPFYFKSAMTPAALLEHYRRVADASPIPILVYSIPQLTGVSVEPPLAAKLAEHPNIIGIKESSGIVLRIAEIVSATPARFQTVVGSAGTFLPSMSVGAIGGILGLACVLPELCLELYRAAQAGDLARARDLQQRLLAPSKRIVGDPGPAGVKYAMDKVGYIGGQARRPFLPLSEEQKRGIDAAISEVSASASVSHS